MGLVDLSTNYGIRSCCFILGTFYLNRRQGAEKTCIVLKFMCMHVTGLVRVPKIPPSLTLLNLQVCHCFIPKGEIMGCNQLNILKSESLRIMW